MYLHLSDWAVNETGETRLEAGETGRDNEAQVSLRQLANMDATGG